MTLALALLWTPLTTHAQTGPDIDWASVLNAETDPGVQISTCDRPDPRDPAAIVCVKLTSGPLPDSGYAAIDLVTYGDIVGDGGTEAVVRIDSGGSIGEIGSLVYALDPSGTPQLVVVDGPGGRVFIDPQARQLVSIGFNQNCSSMNCPSGLIRTGYRLVSGELQAQGSCEFLPGTADQGHP